MSKNGGGKRPPSGGHRKNNTLLKKEQEFLQLNAALEEKTTNLLSEAEAVLREQETLLSSSNTSSGLSKLQRRDPSIEEIDAASPEISTPAAKKNLQHTKQKLPGRPNSGRTQSGSGRGRPGSGGVKQGRLSSGLKAWNVSEKTTQSPSRLDSDVIDERVTLANAISTIEAGMADEFYTPSKMDENSLPVGAEEMGDEAVIRFLKAKLRVMQEELDKVVAECQKKDSKIDDLNKKIKDITADQNILLKSKTSVQGENEKLKKQASELREKNSEQEQKLSGLKKEIDSVKRDQKQGVTAKNAVEVRLNRALEEVEKYKASLLKAKESTKDSNDQDRKRIDHLQTENRKLERQRNELMTAFKKQMKLIDILKRQKMHIEAAKMLQFTEEEFIKALDWGS